MTPAERQPPAPRATTEEAADVAGRFRAAMQASSPVFSSELHTTVMRALRTQRAQNTANAARVPRPGHPWRFALLAAAAAIAVAAGVVVIVLLLADRPKTAIVKEPEPPANRPHSPDSSHVVLLPPTLHDAAAFVEPVKSRVDQAQRAFLTRSADRVQRYCIDQLRIFPAHPPRDAADERTDRTAHTPVAG